jgi:hypothetical protein
MALIARHPSRVPAILATMAGGSRPEAPQRGLAYKCKERHIACILHDWPAPLHVLPGLAQLGLINLGRQAYGQTDSFMASTDDRQAGTWSVSSPQELRSGWAWGEASRKNKEPVSLVIPAKKAPNFWMENPSEYTFYLAAREGPLTSCSFCLTCNGSPLLDPSRLCAVWSRPPSHLLPGILLPPPFQLH